MLTVRIIAIIYWNIILKVLEWNIKSWSRIKKKTSLTKSII